MRKRWRVGYALQRLAIPYKKLSPDEVEEFEWRVHYFLDTTPIVFVNFENGPHPFLMSRVKALIGILAAQMTFRLPDDCFRIYHKVIVYPDYYFSRISKQYHKGETNAGAGVIVFSMRGIQEGIELPFDGVNLIFHEFAHALMLEHKGMDYNLFDEEALEDFERFAKYQLASDPGEEYFLRDYALTNVMEYFAVASENFFERPAELQKAMPRLYGLMVSLYRQDPLQLRGQ